MNIFKILIKRFYAGFVSGEGFIQKIKASFGFIFISFISPLKLRLKKNNKIYIANFTNGSDVAMWTEVFFDEEYKLSDDFFPKKILDLGANVGFSSIYFSLRDPDAYIVAVEPDPRNFRNLEANISFNKNIKALKLAISSQEGEKDFFCLKNRGMGSSFIRNPSANMIKVFSKTLDGILRELKWESVDLIKFDIEGSEWGVFEDAPLNQVKALIGEYHEDLVNRPLGDFLKLFSAFKFRVFMISSKRYIIYFYR